MSHPHFSSVAPFLSRLIAFVIAAIVAAIPMTSGSALQHVETAARLVPRLEVVVIESEYCVYCDLFRRDVVANYQDSPRARDVPLRFLNLEDVSARKLVLAEPISVVPTVLVLRDNEEMGRTPVMWAGRIFPTRSITCSRASAESTGGRSVTFAPVVNSTPIGFDGLIHPHWGHDPWTVARS